MILSDSTSSAVDLSSWIDRFGFPIVIALLFAAALWKIVMAYITHLLAEIAARDTAMAKKDETIEKMGARLDALQSTSELALEQSRLTNQILDTWRSTPRGAPRSR